METDKGVSAVPARPRPALLILLGIAAAAFLMIRLVDSTGAGGASSDLRNSVPPAAADGAVDPARLDVQLEALTAARPGFGEFERNPFRFQARTAGSPAGGPARADSAPPPVAPLPGPQVPAVPPITVRFIGLVDRQDGTKVAVFVDCTVGRRTSSAQQGGIVDGRYRLVQIGLQSVVIEHLDGRGRTTLPLTGQDCVGK